MHRRGRGAHVNLRSLRYFVTIVELSGISRAARALHIAQPALTQHVAALEEKLKVQLLLRTVNGVVPTDAGMALYRNARQILRQIDQTVLEVQAQGDQPRGKVSIGMPTAVAYVLTVPLLGEIRRRYPEIELHIIENMSGILLELLSSGRLDMSFLYDGGRQAALKSFKATKVLDEELVYVSAAKEVVPSVSLQDLVDVDWVLPAAPGGTRQIIDTGFARLGRTPRVVAELSSAKALKGAILSGYGASILPPAIIMEDVARGEMRAASFTDVDLSRPLSLCVPANVPLSPAGQRVHDTAVEVVQMLIDPRVWPTVD